MDKYVKKLYNKKHCGKNYLKKEKTLMKQSYFMKIYRKRWTYRLIAMGAMGIIIVTLLSIGAKTYYDNTNNPTVVKDTKDYKKALDNESYIKISSDKLYDLDVVMTETRSKFNIKISENIKSKFLAIKLGEFILPIEVSNKEYEQLMKQEKGPYILRGTLTEIKDNDLKILTHSIEENEILSNGEKHIPYYQYLEYKNPIDSALFYFVTAAMCLVYILVLFMGVMRKNSIALKSLKNYCHGDIEAACQQIDNEISLSNVYKNGPVTLTKNYIIVETQQIVFALPIKELMWVYKQNIKRKVYGIIPAGKTNTLVLVFSDKRRYKVDLFKGEKTIDQVIEYISENCGTCFVGYSEDLHKLVDKDSEEFILKWKNHKERFRNEEA